jgi:hypothetical protein
MKTKTKVSRRKFFSSFKWEKPNKGYKEVVPGVFIKTI